MNEFVSWCRHLLVSFLFHALTSLHPPSFHRNDFSTCINWSTTERLCREAVAKYKRKWSRREKVDVRVLNEWECKVNDRREFPRYRENT